MNAIRVIYSMEELRAYQGWLASLACDGEGGRFRYNTDFRTPLKEVTFPCQVTTDFEDDGNGWEGYHITCHSMPSEVTDASLLEQVGHLKAQVETLEVKVNELESQRDALKDDLDVGKASLSMATAQATEAIGRVRLVTRGVESLACKPECPILTLLKGE